MRILQLHTRYRQSGGEDSAVRAQAALLRSAGHEVVEHHLQNPPEAGAAARALAQAPWNRRAAAAVRDVIERERPDVAHLHNWWYAMSPAVVDTVVGQGVPLVATLHNYRLHCANAWVFRDGGPCTDCFGGSLLPGVRHACYQESRAASAVVAATIAIHRRRNTWDRVDQLVTVSQAARDLFAVGGMDPASIVVQPNPVEDPGPRAAPPSRSRTVLVVTRLSSEKGVERVLDAWGRAAPTGLDLVVVGDGPQRAELEATAPQGVTFTGRLPADHVRTHMLAARALLFPTLTLETFGLVAVEAMAAGIAPAVPQLGGLPEVVAPGGGWLVGDGRVEDWIEAIGALGDDVVVDRAGEVARARYDAQFAPSIVLAALEGLYDRLLSRAS